MATIDLSGYRMVANFRNGKPWVSIQTSTQGEVSVDDTLILREDEAYRVTRVSDGPSIGYVYADLEPVV